MTTFDLISNFILSAILSGYIISGKAGWKGFSVVIAVYFSINYLINLIGHTNWGRRLIIGTPTILIDKGKINRRNLQKMNMNMTDFYHCSEPRIFIRCRMFLWLRLKLAAT